MSSSPGPDATSPGSTAGTGLTASAAGARRRQSPRGQIVAWGLWDWASSAFHAVILTFVFSVYLTDAVGEDLPGSISASSWLGWALGLSGLVIAVVAPVSGRQNDAHGRRKRSLALLTLGTVGLMAAMFFVKDDYHYLWLGLVLLGAASVVAELA